MGPGRAVDAEGEVPDVAERRLLRRALVHQGALGDVGQGDVVLGEGRPLPHVARGRGVEHRLAGEHGADAAGDRLGVVGRDGRGGVVVHCGASDGSRAVTIRP